MRTMNNPRGRIAMRQHSKSHVNVRYAKKREGRKYESTNSDDVPSMFECDDERAYQRRAEVNSRAGDKTKYAHYDSSPPDVDILREDTFVKGDQLNRLITRFHN